MLNDIILEKRASKAKEAYKTVSELITSKAKAPRSDLEYIDREILGTRFTDIPNWFKGNGKAKKVMPYVGAATAGLSLLGAYDIMNNKDYKYSFNDVYWGLTGLPVYGAYRGVKAIGDKLHVNK